jgi:hypothetical protein
LAKYYAGKNDFRTAAALTSEFAAPPVLPEPNEPGSAESLQQKLYADPNNFSVGYALFRAQTQEGKVDDALATVRHFTAQAGVPAYFYYLEAESWATKQNWERAWKAWLAFERAK